MGKCKTKTIQADLGIFTLLWHIHAYSDCPDIFRHIQAYSGTIQAYSEPCVTLGYSELCYIEHPGIFKTRICQRHIQNPGTSTIVAHSEPEKC